MGGPVLEVRDVVKRYAKVCAVGGLSFDVESGEIFALLGPNGAGKTTMVRMLLRILGPDSGSIRWTLGGNSSAVADPRLVGYLPEERGLHKDVPVLRSLTHFGRLHGMALRDARQEGRRWLEKLELADRAREKLDTLSKGNQQKVQFAAAVLHRPAFVVLDEPFSGFDPVNQERFLGHIREMREQGTTVVLSAHQMQLVERVADRILLIDRGREVLAGRLDEIRSRVGASRRLRLEVDAPVDTAALARCPGVRAVEEVEGTHVRLALEEGPLNDTLAALGHCVTILGVHDERPTLHDIYVDAVRRSGGAAAEEDAA